MLLSFLKIRSTNLFDQLIEKSSILSSKLQLKLNILLNLAKILFFWHIVANLWIYLGKSELY